MKNNSTLVRIPITRLISDDDYEVWAELESTGIRCDTDEKIVYAYVDRMKEGDIFPPIVVFRDGDNLYVGDGFHRIEAAVICGFKEIEAEVRDGTRLDAIWYGLAANSKHGHRLSPEDRDHAVKRALEEFPDKSLRDIAERIGCSHEFVRKLKDEVSSVDNCPATVTGKDGKKYPAKKKKKQKPAPATNTPAAEPVQTVPSDSDPGDAENVGVSDVAPGTTGDNKPAPQHGAAEDVLKAVKSVWRKADEAGRADVMTWLDKQFKPHQPDLALSIQARYLPRLERLWKKYPKLRPKMQDLFSDDEIMAQARIVSGDWDNVLPTETEEVATDQE